MFLTSNPYSNWALGCGASPPGPLCWNVIRTVLRGPGTKKFDGVCEQQIPVLGGRLSFGLQERIDAEAQQQPNGLLE
ncbi:MAG: hypothetical protein QHJ82_12470 [Verrucomicrobiota bacterium]|nr:hypothetical protein [Verrucomicrobiota bacterium]